MKPRLPLVLGLPELPARGSPLGALASAIPAVTALEDPDGVEARAFGAATSGTALAIDSPPVLGCSFF